MNTNTMEMSEMDLAIQDLEKVNGGGKGRHVSKYDGIIGQKYYFYADANPSVYFIGILVKSYEAKVIFKWTKREHVIRILSQSPGCVQFFGLLSGDCALDGDTWTMYEYV